MGTKSDPVLIRDAVADDIPAMVELLAQLFSIEQDFVPDAEKQGRGLALLLAQPGAHVLVAEREGRVVGMISVQTLISTAEGGLWGWWKTWWWVRGIGGRGLAGGCFGAWRLVRGRWGLAGCNCWPIAIMSRPWTSIHGAVGAGPHCWLCAGIPEY